MDQLNSSVVTSNISSSDGHPPLDYWNSSGLIPTLLMSFCFLLGVPGNIAVIILRPNWQHLSVLSQNLMLNFVISDLLCLLTLPLLIYNLLYSWPFGLVTCKHLKYLVCCSLYGSLPNIIVTFFVLWMPYHITIMLVVVAISLNNDSLLKSYIDSLNIVVSLVFVNSFLNPFLYAFATRNMCTVCQKKGSGYCVNAEARMSKV